MKITESQLRRIIREEIALNEVTPAPPPTGHQRIPVPKGVPPRGEAPKGVPPKGVPPKGEEPNKIVLPPAAKTLINNAMAEFIALGEKYKQAAEDPSKEAPKEILPLPAPGGSLQKQPLTKIIKNFWAGISATLKSLDVEQREAVVSAVKISMSVDPETGEWKPSEKGTFACNYVLYEQPSLEKVAKICASIPTRMRMTFTKMNIQQP